MTNWEKYWNPPTTVGNVRIVYTGQEAPKMWKRSVFLAGPTKRQDPNHLQEDGGSWRKEAVAHLDRLGFDGVVFYPEYAPEGKE